MKTLSSSGAAPAASPIRLLLLLSLLLTGQSAWAQFSRYEAENATYVDRFNNDPTIPFSGSGFVDNLTTSYTSTVIFHVAVPSAGDYNVSLHYATALAGPRYLRIYVNGAPTALADFASTNGWQNWRNRSLLLSLPAGPSDIEYRVEDTNAGFGWVNLDYLWLSREVDNGPFSQPIGAGDQLLVAKLVQLPVPASSPVTSSGGKAIINNLASSGNRLFAADAVHGIIHEFFDDNGRRGLSQEFFNVRAALGNIGHELYAYSGNEPSNYNATTNLPYGGIRGVAFHPNFASNGRFYTSQLEFQTPSPNVNNYIGPQYATDPSTVLGGRQIQAVSTVVEWTCTARNAQNEFIGAGATYREVCRISLPGLTRTATSLGVGFDHYIAEIHFGPDGMLYIAHGDCTDQSGGGLDNDALGKLLRIDPNPSGNRGYTLPVDNPALPGVPAEVFARGFRNPHTFDFWQYNGVWHLILADAGRNNVEEINLVQGGKDYGWPNREGTFEHFRTLTYNNSHELVSALPGVWDGYEYPAAQWGHAKNAGQAIAGGGLYDNPATGRTQYLFADLSGTGRFFYCNAPDLLATTRNYAGGALTQATVKQYALLYDDDINNAANALVQHPTLTSLLGSGRSDIRFGRGPNGALYFSSKQTGCIYRIQNVEPGNAYEAELATWGGGVQVGPAGPVADKASNKGFLEYFTNVGAWVNFAVTVPADGLYNVEMRYAKGTPGLGSMSVTVDNTDLVQAQFPTTTTWENWQTQTITLFLTAGTHSVQYQYNNRDTGWINADCIRLKRATYEAEDALTDARKDLNVPGYRGTGYVDNIIVAGNYVKFTVTVQRQELYTIGVRYAAARGQTETLGLRLNGVRTGQVSLPTTSSWYTWATTTHTLLLQPGVNEIQYEYNPGAGDTGWCNLDYIDLQRAAAPCGNCQPNQRFAKQTAASETMAYPNPANDRLTLPQGAGKAVLLNTYGKAVQYPDATGQLDVRSLPAGLYNLQLQQGGKVRNQHIEIQH
jgi:hypothetical protein